ncbi:class C sortase [Leucobacter albus]|uniref:Class C sortase n=1 Tax=Leucobacter albus TaxID=272210 RepID=A0ABW3TMK1_9MICO
MGRVTRDRPGAPVLARPSTAERLAPVRRRSLAPLLLQLLAMIGIGALVYPSAADWFATLAHDAERSGYVRAVAGEGAERATAALEAAQRYNEALPQALLLDPYARDAQAHSAVTDQAQAAYEEVLRVNGTEVIGEVLYPSLNIGLPLYHGTEERAITRGAGHLFGTSLPVGGPSTHAVLTSHSGLVNAKLFTRLPQAQIGDDFELRVLGESMFYRVDRIETVEPFVTDSLGVTAGEDRVTLFTCTPIGINSHRLLVSATRVDPPSEAGRDLRGDGQTAGFPWWALTFLASSGAIAWLLYAPRRPRAAALRGGAQ